MKLAPNKATAALAVALALLAWPGHVRAQSADALIDKLVEKGILTVQEANDLREEADQNFRSAYQVKSGLPDWVNSFKLNGDLRLRYDGIYADHPNLVDRNRFRYRLRFGATAVMSDDFEVGFRLMSGEGTTLTGVSDPISGNTSFDNNGAKKGVFIDLVYAKWSPLHGPHWSGAFTAGKMENPFVFSEIVFEPDYTPEGFGQQLAYSFNDQHALKFNLGEFVLDEISASSQDPYLVGAQIRFDSVWTPKIQTSLGASALAITGVESLSNAAVPDQNRGNTRIDKGATGSPNFVLAHDFTPLVIDASLTYTRDSFPFYSGAFPIRVGGEYVRNFGAPDRNQAYSIGITFGKSGRKGTWDLTYKWKYLEADYWYEELVDSDHGAFYEVAPVGGRAGYGAGTNLRGHYVKAAYSPFDSFTVGLTYYLFDLIDPSPTSSDSQTGRLQIDGIWKF
jgi:hypothetical protein